MKQSTTTEQTAEHSLAQIALLTGLSARTIRYYIQLGLIDSPTGETRAARYGEKHIEQLMLVTRWSRSGISLDRIRDLLRGEPPPVTAKPKVVGAIEVCSHLTIAEGVELVVESARSGMTPEQFRAFARSVMKAHADVMQSTDSSKFGSEREQNSNKGSRT